MAEVGASIKSITKSRSNIYNVAPQDLHVKPGYNSRDFNDPTNVEYVDELARSIAAEGVKRPLEVFFEAGKCYVNDGECRWRGSIKAIETYKAELSTIPVQVVERHSNEADRVLNQYILNSGKPFTAMELSAHFKRLLALGKSQTEIATKTGLTNARISQILQLQTLPEPVKEMVVKQQVSASTAVAMVKEQGGSQAEVALKQGLEKAQADGRTKVKPSTDLTTPPKVTSTVNIRTALSEAFEGVDIDNSDEAEVILRMSYEKFEVIRNLLDL